MGHAYFMATPAYALVLSFTAQVDISASAPPQAILDGETSEFADVVALAIDDRIYCTASMLSPRIGLTAAHCVALLRPEVLSGESERATIDRVVIHPEFDAALLEHDVALFEIDVPLSGISGVVLGSEEVPRPGDVLEAVGFGSDGGDLREQRRGEVIVSEVGAEKLRVAPGPGRLCSGDSGAPLFGRGANAERRVVGVTSSGDAACATFAMVVRLDAEADVLDTMSEELSDESTAPLGHCSAGGSPPGPASALGLAALLGFERRARRRRVSR